MDSYKYSHSIAWRLMYLILVFGLIIGFIFSGLQFATEYYQNKSNLMRRLVQIEQTYSNRLSEPLWNLDDKQINDVLTTISLLPQIAYIELTTNRKVFRAGEPLAERVYEHSFSIYYLNNGEKIKLGDVYVAAEVYSLGVQLLNDYWPNFILELTKNLLIAFFTLFLFFKLISRHLRKMALYLSELDEDSIDNPLELNRYGKPKSVCDELDMMALSINAFRGRVKARFASQSENEHVLLEQMIFLNKVISHIPSSVFWKDKTLTYLGANQNFAVDMGLTHPDDLDGKTDYDLSWSDKDIDQIRFLEKSVMESGKGRYNIERSYVLKGGREIVWLSSIVPLMDDEQEVVGVLGINTDITEAKQRERQNRNLNQDLVKQLSAANRAEQSLKNIRNYLRSIIDSMPSVLAGVSTDGRVTQWNKAAQEATGLSTRQAIGQLLDKVLPQLVGKMELVKLSIRQQKTQKCERVLHYVNGNRRMFNIIIYPLISHEIEGAVVRVDDITSQIRLEEMMVQTEKMMSVGGLAAGMAHEINNPLGGILQGSQNIMRRLSTKLPKNVEVAEACGVELEKVHNYMQERKILQFLDGIREAGERAAEIVTNMLNFSRQSQGQGQPEELNKIVEQSVELAAKDYDLKKRFDFRSIEIHKNFTHDLPLVVCQTGEIIQVMLNLLKNAAQAMDEQTDPKIWLSTHFEDTYAVIKVTDNGPGMDEKTRSRIFEPFFTTKEVGVGTGLGLSVSYFIITNNHKGMMTVESSPGNGATFTISLPVARDA